MKHKLKLAFYVLSTVVSGLTTLFLLMVVLSYINDDKSGLYVGLAFLIISGLIFVYCAIKFKKENGEAVVFTNSRFTKRAIETAKATQVLLWDRTKLIEMIDNLNDKNIKDIINNAI